MANMYIEEQYTVPNLVNIYAEISRQLALLGALYGGEYIDHDSLDDFSRDALELHAEGYELGEQIYDCYSELGAILEAFKQICGE